METKLDFGPRRGGCGLFVKRKAITSFLTILSNLETISERVL